MSKSLGFGKLVMIFTSYLTSSHYFLTCKREIIFPCRLVVKDSVTIEDLSQGPGTG